MKTKKCNKCGENKPLSEYYKRKIKSGTSYRPSCKKCNYVLYRNKEKESARRKEIKDDPKRWAEYLAKQREYRNNRAGSLSKFVNSYKETKGCKYCSEMDPVCLDCHHRDPKLKDKAISRLVLTCTKIGPIVKELAKCDIVCRNCHSKIHAGRIDEDQ